MPLDPRLQELQSMVDRAFGEGSLSGVSVSAGEGGSILKKAQELGISPAQLAQMSNGRASEQEVVGFINQFFPNMGGSYLGSHGYQNNANPAYQPQSQTQQQPYGLAGSEMAILMGMMQGLGLLNQTAQSAGNAYQSGIAQFAPYTQAGTAASNRQAALAGAMGNDAQSAAFEEYQSSPWVDQVRQNAERAIMQNAAATGEVGSSNVLDRLYQNSAGIFLDDFYTQQAALGDIANRGLGAASNTAGLYQGLGQTYTNLGQQAATLPVNAANQIGAYRYQAGRDISQNLGGVNSGLAGLVNQQGSGLADIVNSGTNNVQNLLQSAYNNDANAKQQLMTLLSNLSVGAGSQSTALPIVPGYQSNYMGQLGQMAGGIGSMLAGLNAMPA